MQIINTMINSLGLQPDVVLNAIVILILIATFTLIGAYLHEVYGLIQDSSDKIEVNKIVITCVPATMILFYFADRIVTSIGYKGLVLVCFAVGAAGYPFVGKVYNGEFLKRFIKRVFNIDLDNKKEEGKG